MRVLVAAWVGSANLGDELIFRALARKLTARGTTVTAISVDPAATARTHGVEAVSHRDLPALVGAFRRADRLVFGGGGLLQDETSPWNLPYHLSRLWLARRTRTPFALVGVGAGPLLTRLGRRLVRAGLMGHRGVSVRDRASAELLAALGIEDVTVGADLALSLYPPSDPPEDVLVACLRPWSGRRGLLPVSLRRSPEDASMVGALAAALDQAADRTGLPVRLVVFQRGRDDRFHHRLAERMRTPTEHRAPDLEGILGEVARARAVVAMRYHAGLGAVLAGRPAVLVGYSPKVGSLAEDLGPAARILPHRPEAMGGLAEAVEDVLGREEDVRAARDRLREREAANDRILDRLLEDG